MTSASRIDLNDIGMNRFTVDVSVCSCTSFTQTSIAKQIIQHRRLFSTAQKAVLLQYRRLYSYNTEGCYSTAQKAVFLQFTRPKS